MVDTDFSSFSDPTSNSNKRRRLLTDDDRDRESLLAQIPLLEVLSCLEYQDLLAFSAVNQWARAKVESGMKRVYHEVILKQHAFDETFVDRVCEPPNRALNMTEPLPFRYLVRKAMNTHLYEITVTAEEFAAISPEAMAYDPDSRPSIRTLVLSQTEGKLGIVFGNDHLLYGTALLYDLNTKQRFGGPLLLDDDWVEGLYFLDDGRVISHCYDNIRIWALQENDDGKWIERIRYNSPIDGAIEGGAVYKQREIIFSLTENSAFTYKIKALDLKEGSVRDLFMINLMEEFTIDPTSEDLLLKMDIFGDRGLLFYVKDVSENEDIGGACLYDMESSQRIQSVPKSHLPIFLLTIKNSQSKSRFIYKINNCRNGHVRPLQPGDNGEASQLESFGMQLQYNDEDDNMTQSHNSNTFIGALHLGDDGQLTPVKSFGMQLPNRHDNVEEVSDHQLIIPRDRGLFVYDFATGEHVRTLRGCCGVIAASRNEILTVEGEELIQIRAYCLEEPRLCNLE